MFLYKTVDAHTFVSAYEITVKFMLSFKNCAHWTKEN